VSTEGPPRGARPPQRGGARSALRGESTNLALASLVATSAIQVYTSFAGTAAAVLAPVLARDLGITPKWIGVFIGLVYVGGMFASAGCGTFIRRHGAIRVSQAAVLICAAGIAAVAWTPPHGVALAAVAAVVIGIGYGAITPASSHVLAQTTPPQRMSLVFSIKQTGVPAGAALGGAALPGLALAFGWRTALLGTAVAGLIVALCAEPIREALDADRQPGLPFSFAAVAEPLAIVRRTPALARLAALSFMYSAVQVSLTSFIVVYLTESLHWTLVAAGFVLTLTTLAGVVGRIGWGALADRGGNPRRVLALIGVLATLAAAAFVFATPQWPAALIGALAAMFGATAIGWNGVQLAEVARRAPRGKAGAVTGASGFVTFFGVVVGPPAFAALAGGGGGYGAAFALLAVLAMTGAALSRGNSP
jgi:MFS family permease